MPDFESFFGCKPSASHTFVPANAQPIRPDEAWELRLEQDGSLRMTVNTNDPGRLAELRVLAEDNGWTWTIS